MDRPDLTPRVRDHLDLWAEERRMVPAPYNPEGDLPAETPITPGCTVRLVLSRFYLDPEDHEWDGIEDGPVGVVTAINYGRAGETDPTSYRFEDRNHWRYHVIWAQEDWDFVAADGDSRSMFFTSARGSLGWLHPWRHDQLDMVRDPWAEAERLAAPETLRALGDLAERLKRRGRKPESP